MLLFVFGGYVLVGGYLGVLIQFVEILMIVGVGVGVFIFGNGGKIIKVMLCVLLMFFKGLKYMKDVYMELMVFFYVLFVKVCKEGMLMFEVDIDDL